MNRKWLISLSTITLLLSACGVEATNNESETNESKSEVVPVETKVKTETVKEEEREVALDETTNASSETNVNIDQVKKVKIGMSKDEVIGLVGLDFKKTSIMYDGEAGWLLDEPLPKFIMDYSDGALVDGYAFESEFEDEVDIEGIYSQQRGSMVIIRLSDEGFVEQVMAIYYNQDDKHIYEYYLFEDGFVKDHAIYPYPEQ